MAETEYELETWCPNCERPCSEGSLRRCVICRTLFCRTCGVSGYGREFCSASCRGYFFYGDADDAEDDE